GSERLFRELGALDPAASVAPRPFSNEGQTAMLVGVAANGAERPEIRGAIALADRPRPESAAALGALRGAGIDRLVMLTGDNDATARALASELGQPGLDEVRAGLLPDDKVAAIQDLRRGGA